MIRIKPDARKKSKLPFLLQCVPLSSLRSLANLLIGMCVYAHASICVFNRNERERFNWAKPKTTPGGKSKTSEDCPLETELWTKQDHMETITSIEKRGSRHVSLNFLRSKLP